MRRVQFTEGQFLNPDQIVTFSYDLHEITPELSKGDIYDVDIFVTMSNKVTVEIRELEYLKEFVEKVYSEERGAYIDKRESLDYYVRKMAEYYRTKELNKQEGR